MKRISHANQPSFRRFSHVSLLAVFALATGSACKSQDTATPTPEPSASASAVASVVPSASSEPSAVASATPPPPKITVPRNAGRAGLLLNAVVALDVREPEKVQKLDAIGKSFKEEDGTRDEAKAIHDELVSQVKAGKIDNAKLEPLYVALEKGAKEAHDKEVTALDGIYAALVPLERKVVVEDIRKKVAARESHMPKEQADAGAPRGPNVVDRMTKNLGLDEAQQKKAAAIVPTDERKKMLADHEEDKKQLEALLSAFEKDGFDAKKVPGRDPKKARVLFQEQAKVFAQLVPILKPEQREKLAAGMQNAKGLGGHGGPGPGGLPHHPMKPGPHGARGWGDGEP